jgi:hypothetical protein
MELRMTPVRNNDIANKEINSVYHFSFPRDIYPEAILPIIAPTLEYMSNSVASDWLL